MEQAQVASEQSTSPFDALQGYDIIGDVHGMADKLHALLLRMNYQQIDGVWQHPKRTAIFIGDLIDNGIQTRETLTTVRNMVNHGAALAIMGNHELNAVAWEMRHSRTGQPLRAHSDTNQAHHQAFLDSIPNKAERLEWLSWFKTLPLFLDLGDIRCIHACWHEPSLQHIKPYINTQNQLHDDAWEVAFEEGHEAFIAIENLLKGIEIDLPQGMSFLDHKGKERFSSRISWWLQEAASLADMVHIPAPSQNAQVLAQLNRLPADHTLLQSSCYQGQCPVFFGHYWLKPPPAILHEKAACTDYSAGKDGPLVAYRWCGENNLTNRHWISSTGA